MEILHNILKMNLKKSTKQIKNILGVFGDDNGKKPKYLTITENQDFIQEMKNAEIPGRWRDEKPVDHDPELSGVDVHLIVK